MTSLSALFVLASLCCYLLGRQTLGRGLPSTRYFCAAFFVFFPLAMLSKETGALVPLYVGLIECMWFGLRLNGQSYPKRFSVLLAMLIGIPVIVVLVILLGFPELLLEGYANRHFSLTERLLTQARVVWLYLNWSLLPNLLSLGLFHDDISLSTGWLQPLSTLWAVFAWIVTAVFLILMRQRAPMIAFGVGFFLAAHVLESSVLPLELVFEHRNYLPLVGLLLAAVAVLQTITHWLGKPWLAFVLITAFAIYCAALTAARANSWSSLAAFSAHQYLNHPESARSNYQMGRIYAGSVDALESSQQRDEAFTAAVNHFVVATQLDEDFVDGLFGLLVLYSSNGLEVPDGLRDELWVRLEQAPLSASAINQINNLVVCRTNNVCDIEPQWLQALMQMLHTRNVTPGVLLVYQPQ